MASLFTGWIGYGVGVQSGTLQEPADSAYIRRPIQFSAIENGLAFDVGGGTVGPSSVAWGNLNFAGLFDAQSGGNLLIVFALPIPVYIGAGVTYTTGPGSNVIFSHDLGKSVGTQTFPPGTSVGASPDGRQFIANVPLQVSGGILSGQSITFGATVTMATLPGQQPTTGSGQLWNNGGIVAVA